MTEQCPTVGFTCVDQMRARVQSITDQIEGFRAFVESTSVVISNTMILKHYQKCAELLQAALDGYSEQHGMFGPEVDLEAVRWVLTELKK